MQVQFKIEKTIEIADLKKKKHEIISTDGEKPITKFKIEETFFNQ